MVKDKVIFITGAAQGIGFEIGKEFAASGARVVLTDLQAEGAEKAADSLKAQGYEAIGMQCDVTSEEELKEALDKTVEHFGRLDVLINNAGLQHVSHIEEFPTERFELLLKVMLTAPFVAIKHALPHMKKQGNGKDHQYGIH